MGMKKVYSCNICRDETPMLSLTGLNFSGMKTFKLDTPQSTDGVHICDGCLQQLREQLAAGVPHIAARASGTG